MTAASTREQTTMTRIKLARPLRDISSTTRELALQAHTHMHMHTHTHTHTLHLHSPTPPSLSPTLLQWANHDQSLKLEESTRRKILARIEDKVAARSGTWIDWQYLLDAADLLRKVSSDCHANNSD